MTKRKLPLEKLVPEQAAASPEAGAPRAPLVYKDDRLDDALRADVCRVLKPRQRGTPGMSAFPSRPKFPSHALSVELDWATATEGEASFWPYRAALVESALPVAQGGSGTRTAAPAPGDHPRKWQIAIVEGDAQ